MKKYLLAILLLCGVAYAGDVYRVRIPALGIDTTVEVEKVETPPPPPPEPEPEPEPEPDPTPTPEPPPPGEIADGLMTDAQRAVLKRLWKEKHPLALAVQQLAENDLGYNQQGEWATLCFIATEDSKWAGKAYEQFRRRWIDPAKLPEARSDTREFLATIALHYQWCRPGLTDEQAAEWRRILFLYADLCLDQGPIPWGTRINDDDEVLGHCVGLVKIAQATAKEEPEKSAAILNHPKLAEMRAAIRKFCEFAKGGEWGPGDGYSVGTSKLALIGVFACGKDEFPEVFEYLKDASKHHAWTLTPDLKTSAKYGDTYVDTGLLHTTHIAYSAMLAGLMGNRNERALYEILSKQQPWWIERYRVLWVLDPEDVPTEPYVAPSGFKTTGIGLHIHRGPHHFLEVFTPRDCVLPDGQQLDHTTHQGLSVGLRIDGDQVIDHPIGYPPAPSSYNCVLFGGFDRFAPASEQLEITAEETPTGCRIVWRLKMREAKYGIPPFVNGFTRTVEFTAPNKLTVTDKFDGKAPDLVNDPYWSDKWKAWMADIVRNAPALWQSIYHTPVAPTKTATGYEWQTKGGHKVTLTTDARAIVLKTTPENTPGSYAPGQLDGSQIRLLSDEPTAELKATIEVN